MTSWRFTRYASSNLHTGSRNLLWDVALELLLPRPTSNLHKGSSNLLWDVALELLKVGCRTTPPRRQNPRNGLDAPRAGMTEELVAVQTLGCLVCFRRQPAAFEQ